MTLVLALPHANAAYVDPMVVSDVHRELTAHQPLTPSATDGPTNAPQHRVVAPDRVLPSPQSLAGRLDGADLVAGYASEPKSGVVPSIAMLLGSALVGIGTISRRKR